MQLPRNRAGARRSMAGGIALLSLLCSMLAACGGQVDSASSTSLGSPAGTAPGIGLTEGTTAGTTIPEASTPGTATISPGTAPRDTASPGIPAAPDFVNPGSAPGTTASGPTTAGTTPGSSALGTTPVTTPVVPEVVKLGNLTKTFGDGPFQFSPPDGGAFTTLTSSNPAVAVVSGNTVTIVGAGTAKITGTQGATGGSTQTTTATLVVMKAQPGLALSTVTLNALSSDGVPLRASSNSNGVVGYVISNAAVSGGVNGVVATLSRSGSQTLIRTFYAGTATITATQVPTANYAGATVSATLVVQKAESTINLSDVSGLSSDIVQVPMSFSNEVDPLTHEYRVPAFSFGNPAFGFVGWDAENRMIVLYQNGGGTTTMTMSLPETTNLAATSKTVTVTFTQVTAQQDGRQLAAVVNTDGSSNPDYLFDSATNTVTLKLCAGWSEPVLFRFTESSNNHIPGLVYLDGAGELRYDNSSSGYVVTIPNVATGATPLRLRSIVEQVGSQIVYLGKEFDYDVQVLLYQPNESLKCRTSVPV